MSLEFEYLVYKVTEIRDNSVFRTKLVTEPLAQSV
jgi:hypothetical protein